MRKEIEYIGWVWTAAAFAVIALVLAVILFAGVPACSPGPKPPGLTWSQWAPERATICENAQ